MLVLQKNAISYANQKMVAVSFPGGTPENFAETVKMQNQIGFFQLSFFILPVYAGCVNMALVELD